MAFEGTNVIDHEVSLYEFLSTSNGAGIPVGKRAYGDIFSGALSDGNLLKAVSFLLNNPHIKVVNIYRDGRDVIESGIKPARWIAAVRQMLNYQGVLALNLRYEDLVKTPDIVQGLIANKLRLDSIHKFSDYPAFFQGDEVSTHQKYVPREIATDRIGKNLDLYRQRVIDEAEKRVFENLLRSLEYAA
jgi:hypothetical protein